VDAEFELSSASSKFGEDECSEWTTVISKTGTKTKLSKIGVEDTCVNDNESFLVGMRLLSKDTYVGNPFEVSKMVMSGLGNVCQSDQSDQEWSYFDSLYF
jgi:hypothetical protein